MSFNFSDVNIEDISSDTSTQNMIDVVVEGETGQQVQTPPTPQALAEAKPAAEAAPVNTENMIGVDEAGTNNEAPESKSTPEQPLAENSSPSPFKLFGKKLFDEGVLSVFDEEQVNTLEDLQSMVAKTIDAEVQAYKESLPPRVRKIVEHAEQSGEENLERFIAAQKDVMDITNMSETSIREDESLQEKLLVEDLKALGYDTKRIDRTVKNAKANETLEDDALDAFTSIKARKEKAVETIAAETKAQQERLERENAEMLKNLEKDIFTTTEIVPGIKLTKREQDSLYQSMTAVVGTDGNGNPVNAVIKTRMQNPIAFEKTLHFLHSKGVFNVNTKGEPTPDWSFLSKTIKTNIAKETEKVIGREFTPGKPGIEAPGNTDVISAIRNAFGG